MVNLKFLEKSFFFFFFKFLHSPIYFLCILVSKLERRERKLLENNEEKESYWFSYFSAMKILFLMSVFVSWKTNWV